MLGVNLDTGTDQADRFDKTANKGWKQIAYPRDAVPIGHPLPLAERFGIATTPFKMLIDKDGRLVATGRSLAEMVEPVRELVAGAKSTSHAN